MVTQFGAHRPGWSVLETMESPATRRHGTTTLFAALNVLTGVVIGDCMPRHRRRKFLRFLKQIDKEMPADLELHLILDNCATHKTVEVRRWLATHPRFHLHFTPTSASWLNLVAA